GGTKCCGCWKTGSEICDVLATGLGNINGCVPGENCPVVTCSVYGTVDLGDGLCDPNALDPDCGIEGVAFCRNPLLSPLFNLIGTLLTLPTFLTGAADIETCHENGTCSQSIELEPENCPGCCINLNWEFITFTASEFNGQICVCPGGFSTEGTCCDDIQRNPDGSCVTEGVEVCLDQRCTADLTGYEPGQNIYYECTTLP
ncbi:MAG TPA: hypothetical protein VHT73_04015, partial [Thermodesulfobacteriota bacterium]|nr:hypothetical protein [Thermodesulfobacteriota bacterium]